MKNVCQCCDSRVSGTNSKSKLKKGVTFNICGVCAVSGHEPKFWVILYGRANGVRTVEKFLRERLYCGEEILARELV